MPRLPPLATPPYAGQREPERLLLAGYGTPHYDRYG